MKQVTIKITIYRQLNWQSSEQKQRVKKRAFYNNYYF